MLTKINNCRAYADVNKFITLLNVLKSEYRSFQELKTYFSNDIIISVNLADTLKLLEVLGYIAVYNEDNTEKYKANDIEYDQNSIIKDIFDLLIKNNVCELSRIDLDYYLQINQEYYALRNLLFLSGAIIKSNINRFYKIESEYSSYLKKTFKKISKEELLRQLEKQNQIGEQAEKYVVEFERKKFHSYKDIKHVALEDNNAGYDIMSFIDEKSNEYDKFIEVKCYSDFSKRFFISKNEIMQSKKLGKNYFLYLVDSKLDSFPIIIQNPYKSIFDNLEIPYQIENISYDVNEIINQLKLG